MDENYIKSLHYCPICGQVVGCGDGHCDSKQFQEHIAKCREASRVKPGRLRYSDDAPSGNQDVNGENNE